VGTPAASSLEDLTSRVAELERLVSDHAQRFDTLQTPWWKRAWYDLNGRQKRRPWHKGR
jgi:hypothetical protein